MLLDAVLFDSELDILEFRLRLLSPYVDKFIICEADKTFSGKDKPFHYWDNRERFAPWKHKIIHHPVRIDVSHLDFSEKPKQFDPNSVWWHVEKTQRNSLTDILTAPRKDILELGIKQEDTFMMGDVDEFPSRKAIEWATEWITADAIVACRQAFFYYDLTNLRHEHWHGTILTTVRMALLTGAQEMRNRRNMCGFVPDGGWHLSYMGGEKAIRNKVENFSHQELNSDEFKSPDHIAECLKTGADLFNRGTVTERIDPKKFFPGYFQDAAKEIGWL
jgi:beta-1,4-mannosyl-glycoprotein beta-1,4-N-acetylglucosaminyltransferase